MNTTLNTLSEAGPELTTEQLGVIDGGCVVLATCVVIWALGTFDTVMIWGFLQ